MKKINLLSVTLLATALLCGGCGEITSSSSKRSHEEMQYQIYEKAVEEGLFTGTYEEWLSSIKGQDGKDGIDGKNGVGIKSITLTSSEGNVDTYTITYTDGSTTTFTITNGKDGTNGTDGKDGSNGQNGTNGVDGKDGADGKDSPHFGETHVVTFSLGEGEYLPKGSASTITVNYGDVIVLPVPLKPGYVFKGWFTGDTVNDGQWFNHTAVFDDITLKARWEQEVYTLPSTVRVVAGAKDVYHYGDEVTIEPVLEEGKTFAGYRLNVNSFNASSLTWNKISSYAKTYQYNYTFGKTSDLVVDTIDTPEVADGTEGTYIGTYVEDGEEEEITIILDGKGTYTFNGEKSAMELIGTSATWTPGTKEDLYFAPYLISGSEVCFSNASIHIDEEMPDGNSYSYIEAVDDHNEKTWRFWLDGNQYQEPEEIDYAGTYSNGSITITINLDGTGTISGDGYTSATIISSSKESDSKIVLTTEDDTYSLTLQSSGKWKIRYDDESLLLDFKAYVFEYYGIFKGTYMSEDVSCNVSIKVENNKSVTVNDDGVVTNYKITEYTDSSINMENDDGDTLVMTLQTSGANQGKWRVRLDGGTAYLTFVSFANNPLEGVTFKGTCNDAEEEHQIVFKSGMKADYIVAGTTVYSDMDVDISNYPTSVVFSFTNDEEEEESHTATFTGETKFKLNMGDCGTVIYNKQ